MNTLLLSFLFFDCEARLSVNFFGKKCLPDFAHSLYKFAVSFLSCFSDQMFYPETWRFETNNGLLFNLDLNIS